MESLIHGFANALDGVAMYILPMLIIIGVTVFFSKRIEKKYRKPEEQVGDGRKSSTLEGGM
jgi:hypothetical protein